MHLADRAAADVRLVYWPASRFGSPADRGKSLLISYGIVDDDRFSVLHTGARLEFSQYNFFMISWRQ